MSLTEHPPSTNPAEIQVYDYCSALDQLMTEYEKSLFDKFMYTCLKGGISIYADCKPLIYTFLQIYLIF